MLCFLMYSSAQTCKTPPQLTFLHVTFCRSNTVILCATPLMAFYNIQHPRVEPPVPFEQFAHADICKSFVIEAADAKGPWTEILSHSDAMLRTEGGIYPISESECNGRYFKRFRIRMTSPTNTGSHFLMAAWFDVFGVIFSANSNALLKLGVSEVPSL